ncbi:MAG: hypothetical protein Q9M33_09220 [Robiginitomaculum sp.]|nr:hypothetical protein [Robiginitomaculum sp.]MDQ7076381.1 hypothetical protein [Robiginitomaculum sp.]
MAKHAMAFKPDSSEPALSEGDDEYALSNARLRDQLKAHLSWCAYLGAAVDEESLADLAQLLRRTARTMRDFAEQVELHATRVPTSIPTP